MASRLASGHRALRLGRRSIPGQIYLVTTVTRNRYPFFAVPRAAHCASRILGDAATWLPNRCLCWVLMPDHWHGLLQLGDSGNLSAAMHRAKLRCAHAVAAESHLRGGIWAPGFHDRALRRGDDVRASARYVIANPVRAGLVRHVLDYPYWDAIWL
jgi:REP element-mobilizing transposase RayT